jgi:FMN phosphatase YigB (HAD superfamily)
MNYTHLKALLIDIDDTIVRLKRGVTLAKSQHASDWTGSLLDVIQLAGEKMAGLPAEEVAARIARTKAEIRWWQYEDFLKALGVDPAQFWPFAYDTEIHYLEPTGAEIKGALERLRGAGIQLFVTSNNTNTGILHKLRLCGIVDDTLFTQILGASQLKAMKWEPVFWEKALGHVKLDAAQVAVVGDNPRDDFTIPRLAGIAHSFLVDRARDRTAENSEAVTYVQDFSSIADCLLGVGGAVLRGNQEG